MNWKEIRERLLVAVIASIATTLLLAFFGAFKDNLSAAQTQTVVADLIDKPEFHAILIEKMLKHGGFVGPPGPPGPPADIGSRGIVYLGSIEDGAAILPPSGTTAGDWEPMLIPVLDAKLPRSPDTQLGASNWFAFYVSVLSTRQSGAGWIVTAKYIYRQSTAESTDENPGRALCLLAPRS